MPKVKLLNIVIGLLFSILWVITGTILYINSLSALSLGSLSMKFLLYFLWGIPVVIVIIGLLCIKKPGYNISLISFLLGTIILTLLIPVLLE